MQSADKFTSPRGIAELNIEHYSKLLQTSLDEQKRTTVERLLAEEKAKLASLREARNFNAPTDPAKLSDELPASRE